MKIFSKTAMLIVSSVALLGGPVQVFACQGLEITGARLNDAPPKAPVRAAFLQLSNPTSRSIYVQNWQSPAFKAVELHEMKSNGNQMQMRQVTRLRIKPKQTIELSPNGLHLMLFSPKEVLSLAQFPNGIPIVAECKKTKSTFYLSIEQ